MIETKADIIVGLDRGDEGKGALAENILKDNRYTHVMKVSGGPNAGHEYKIKDVVGNQIPAGVLYKTTSIIGAGCVINVEKLFNEMNKLYEIGYKNVYKLVKIAYNAHIITNEMIKEDNDNNIVGSTGQGIMQAYRAKYGRKGIRAEQIKELKDYLIDTIEEFHSKKCKILIEGNQAAMLCPDWGAKYPYVTSGIPTATYALHSAGLNHKNLNNVWGVMKAYTTYSGYDNFQPIEEDKAIYEKICILGKEKGHISGRKRQIRWVNLKEIRRSILLNGCNFIRISKCDILDQLKVWKLYDLDNNLISFSSWQEFQQYLMDFAFSLGVKQVHFSFSPNTL